MNEVCDIVQETGIKTIPIEKKCKKAKWLSGEVIENFDATIGRSTVLMPFGGKTQLTESQVSVQKLPTDGYTNTASIMSFGYNPFIAEWSPYHSAAYAVVEACTKVVAAGADYSKMRFSYQEYFERMSSEHAYGKPLSALLGALKMQIELGLPSIGGKDSMSGTFEHISVPPTLIAFGITTVKADKVVCFYNYMTFIFNFCFYFFTNRHFTCFN